MPHRVEIASNASHVRVTVVGDVTRDVALQFNAAAEDAAGAATPPITRLLVDLREARNVLSVTSNCGFVHQDVPAMHWGAFRRVALLAADDDHSHDFVETVSLNAGLPVRLFRDERAALDWLLSR